MQQYVQEYVNNVDSRAIVALRESGVALIIRDQNNIIRVTIADAWVKRLWHCWVLGMSILRSVSLEADMFFVRCYYEVE